MKEVNKKNYTFIKIGLILVVTSLILFYIDNSHTKKEVSITKDNNTNTETKKLDMEAIIKNFNEFVIINNNSSIYKKENNKYIASGTSNGEIELKLDTNYTITDEYYKIANSDYYIFYQDTKKIDNITPLKGEYKYYKNYVPFDKNIKLKKKAKLFINDNSYFEIDNGSYPVLIENENNYGIEFLDRLVYVNKDDILETITNHNTDKETTNAIGVLNYHYTVSSTNENGELEECNQEICIKDTMFDTQISYLKNNNYYAASLRDLELFIDGKIRLPKNTVVITIDDGWYVQRSIKILEKYQMLGTLFLIGSLANPRDYKSNYLEVHSHSWDLHRTDHCPSSIGRGGILCLDEEKLLADLKKSRESLNNTTYFCYPFYDYNDRSIDILKKAGFTMAFAGEKRGDSKVRKGQDKYTIPRYVIVNYTTMDEFIEYVS